MKVLILRNGMDLSFSEQQEMLRKTARDFLLRQSPPSTVKQLECNAKGYSTQIWAEMVGLGWMGLALPEEYGGSGASFFDLVMLLEEMGRVVLTSPFFTTVVSCGMPILYAGDEKQKREYLPKIVEGSVILTLALTEPAGGYDGDGIETTVHEEECALIVEGTKLFVPYAHVADAILCISRMADKKRGDRFCLLLFDAKSRGVAFNKLDSISLEKQYELILDKVHVPKVDLLGGKTMDWMAIEELLSWSVVGKCAEMLGGAERVLEITADYAKQRVQFGRPIGSFQAIQHRLADMAIDVLISRLLVYDAASKLSQGLSCSKEVASAKSWVSNAYPRVTKAGQQVHAGVGFIIDHDMPLYFRHAASTRVAFGDSDYHRGKFAVEIGLSNRGRKSSATEG